MSVPGLYLGIILSGIPAASACWKCDAGPGEECYLEPYWDSATELAARAGAGRACLSSEPRFTMSMSTGAAYAEFCENGRLGYRQTSPNQRMKIRPIGSGLPEDGSAEREEVSSDVTAEARVACERKPLAAACNEAHAKMVKRAEGLLGMSAGD